ncbi:MAG: uracil-DNA glycosylase [Firmicutes bacterium]|nr:uracil-DNA glycosylase [Bacillota bacterium]
MEVSWEELEGRCFSCNRCPLHKTRTNVVIGVGNRESDVLFVGEGPGYHEDMQGEPFVGAAGQLLDKMLAAINFDRKSIYIGNIVKCRPPNNRDPLPEEQKACIDHLRYQFLLIRPKIIVCLGRIAAQAIIKPDFRITKERGIWFEKKNCHIIATYHPSALLRDETKKRSTWEDMQAIRRKYDELKKNEMENEKNE